MSLVKLCHGGILFLIVLLAAIPALAQDRRTENLLLITFDGLRWEELFGGAEERLLSDERSGIRDRAALRERFWSDDVAERRARLLPFFWNTIAREGQLFGDPQQQCIASVTNGKNFSYPGYNEILTGFADDRIDSNDKIPNRNVTVLEWLHQDLDFQGQVQAVCSWDVFPYIINAERSGIPVNAGWDALPASQDASQDQLLSELAREIPRVWPNVRYDAFTWRCAQLTLQTARPRVLYVALGETDDWAHEGRYDLYLEAACRCDQYVEQLWKLLQADPQYAGKTSLIVTTDHGRGNDREGWKSHGRDVAGSERIWVAVLGPDTPALGVRRDQHVTQAQVAATCGLLLGRDYRAAQPQAAPPLPDVVRE
jgi:hypothetical protein